MVLKKFKLTALALCLILLLTACTTEFDQQAIESFEYNQEASIVINNNIPQFSQDEITTKSFERYSELDALGRCGVAVACIGKDIMPTEERGEIGSVKPSGWHTVKYDIVDGKYLYNRCHLIGYQLTGENANKRNLITGTRSMNVDGMLPFENMVADYVKETGNHVMYRVTPLYKGDDLLAKGVIMEALSVEDNGKGISFNVFVFNAQKGIEINYTDGTSRLLEEESQAEEKKDYTSKDGVVYILNTSSKKFHYENCSSAKSILDKNKETFNGDRSYLIDNGYSPCGNCRP